MITVGIGMIRNSEREDRLLGTIDSMSIYRQETQDLNSELTKALALQQCYHEELIRVVLEYCVGVADTIHLYDGDYLEHNPPRLVRRIYTIPCNGRKVVVR